MTIAVRQMVHDDRRFVVSGWSASLRASRDLAFVPMATYATIFHPIIEKNLDRCCTLVAHGDLDVLMGFIAYDPTTYTATIGKRRVTLRGYVLFAYTAEPFRRHYGVARKLFAAAGISPTSRFGYACRTRSSWELRDKIPFAEYEPFRARYEEVCNVRCATEAG